MHVEQTGLKKHIRFGRKKNQRPTTRRSILNFFMTSQCATGLNSHCFPIMLGDGHQPDSVGFYIPTYNKVGWVDHPQVFQGAIWIHPGHTAFCRLPVLRNKKHKKSRCRKKFPPDDSRFDLGFGGRSDPKELVWWNTWGPPLLLLEVTMFYWLSKILLAVFGWKMRFRLLVILCGDSFATFAVYVTGRFYLRTYHTFEAQM